MIVEGFTKINNTAQENLGLLAKRIPRQLGDIHKQNFIRREIVEKLFPEQRDNMLHYFETLLISMRNHGASDIEIGGPGVNGQIWLRVQGVKHPVVEWGRMGVNETNIFLQSILQPEQRDILFRDKAVDFSYTVSLGDQLYRHRATAYFELGELSLNLRAINTHIRPFADYDFHYNVTRLLNLAHSRQGLVLVTGITGAGKSTTLDSIIDLNNRSVEAHIVIIASPIEFIHTSNRSIIRHREVGIDTHSFKAGTIEALRQDPDAIIIGEMRDSSTIMAALEAADTGHKVFSTLHTASATESIDRIIAEMPPGEQDRVRNRLADVLTCVVSQQLVPGINRRLVLAREIMVMSPPIRSAIKNRNTSEIYQMITEGQKYGMTTMEQDLHQLAQTGRISMESAYTYANRKRRMQQLLKGKSF